MDDFQKQPITEHLAELRQCLIASLVATGVGFAVAYYFSAPLAQWLFRPLFAAMPEGVTLIFTSYQEGFFFI
jgi:sec-independent protein translocase protein TatC